MNTDEIFRGVILKREHAFISLKAGRRKFDTVRLNYQIFKNILQLGYGQYL